MTIYSQDLGHISVADTAVNHLLYTVPLSGGPAIVRSLTISADTAGAIIVVFVVLPDATGPVVEAFHYAGAGTEVSQTGMYQPLPPGSEIYAVNQGSSCYWTVLLGGYQFTSP